MELTEFASEHEKSEQHHLDLLNKILTDKDTSVLLPLWKLSGFTLGFASTIWCPRGMYVTTEAVETFVERHYKDQIHRLENETSSNDSVQQGRMELKRLLEFCCEDEIHHQQEARDRAAQGPFPWFLWVDTFLVLGRGERECCGCGDCEASMTIKFSPRLLYTKLLPSSKSTTLHHYPSSIQVSTSAYPPEESANPFSWCNNT